MKPSQEVKINQDVTSEGRTDKVPDILSNMTNYESDSIDSDNYETESEESQKGAKKDKKKVGKCDSNNNVFDLK